MDCSAHHFEASVRVLCPLCNREETVWFHCLRYKDTSLTHFNAGEQCPGNCRDCEPEARQQLKALFPDL